MEIMSPRICLIFVAVCLVGPVELTAVCDASTKGNQDEDISWANDLFAEAIVGKWSGTGTYEGNEMKLERSWTLELSGKFLRGDMKVLMANDSSFRALTYWRKVASNRYECTWMDEAGQSLSLKGLGDKDRQTIEVQHLSTGPGGPPSWQRTVYKITGKDSYQEDIYRSTAAGWKLVAEFKFTRKRG